MIVSWLRAQGSGFRVQGKNNSAIRNPKSAILNKMLRSFFYQAIFLTGILIFPGKISAQVSAFTRQDTLRGSITPERAWWDLKFYHLDIAVNPLDSTISGTNTVSYRVLHPSDRMQIDLQEPLDLISAVQNGKIPEFKREGNVYLD